MAVDVLLTGAPGVLGREIREILLPNGYRVIACGRTEAADIDAVWDVSVLDAPEPEQDAEVVIHAAARIGSYQQSVSEAIPLFHVNVTGTARVARWCVLRRVKRLVLISSAIVYGEWKDHPKTETDPVRPWSAGPYAVSKWCSEQVAHLVVGSGCELVVLRLASLYGVGYRNGLIQRMLREGRSGREIHVKPPCDDSFDLVHVKDAARAICRAVDAPTSGTWNIGGGSLTSIRELADICALATNSQVVVKESSVTGSRRILNWVDDRRARTDLGHSNSVSLEVGVREIAKSL